MTVRITITPILPKGLKPNAALTRRVAAELVQWQGTIVREMAKYPPQKGHIKYRRTGTLGRSWRMPKPDWKGNDLEAIVDSSEEEFSRVYYAPFVQGYSQVGWAKAYGWKSIADVGPDTWERTRKAIMDLLQDPW